MRAAAHATSASIDAFLDRHRDDLIDTCADLIRIDSQIPPHSDEREVIAFLRERMAELGIGGGEVVGAEAERPNLVTRIAGARDGPALLLNGHVDTKPVGDARSLWRSDPMAPEIRDGHLYGLGAADMKAAVAAMVFAAAAVEASGGAAGDLVLAFTADEEAGASFGSRFLAPRLEGIDACLIGEPSGWERDWQGLHLVSRGLCCFRVRVRGTQMHSSLSDRMPSVNASRLMADLLGRIGDELRFEHVPHPLGAVPTLNAGVIVQGGVFFGVVPGLAEFGCDLRTVPGMSEAAVHAAIDGWLDERRRADPRLDVEVVYEPRLEWIDAAEIDAAHPLVAAVEGAAADVLGAAPPHCVFPGTCDAPWYAAVGIPTIPSFGPGVLTCCHGPNERVSVESVHQAARIYAHAAARFCGSPGA